MRLDLGFWREASPQLSQARGGMLCRSDGNFRRLMSLGQRFTRHRCHFRKPSRSGHPSPVARTTTRRLGKYAKPGVVPGLYCSGMSPGLRIPSRCRCGRCCRGSRRARNRGREPRFKVFNSGGNNGVWVFPDLAVKAGVAYGRLRLLIKLCFIAAVKELGRNGNGFSRIAISEGVLDYVRFAFHGGTLLRITGVVQRINPRQTRRRKEAVASPRARSRKPLRHKDFFI